MLFLSINAGSSSLKFELFKLENKKTKSLINGYIDGLNTNNSIFKISIDKKVHTQKLKKTNHKTAIKLLQKTLIEKNLLNNHKKIEIIGHRIVHGAEIFKKTCILKKDTVKKLKPLNSLAPLHNPFNIKCIQLCSKFFKAEKQILCFDTSYYKDIKREEYSYPIPKEISQKLKIRKYGFHGLNHYYLNKESKKLLKADSNNKIISCHLGGGSSVSSSIDLKAQKCSMEFSPLSGLIMGTRSGSIDPVIPLYISQKLRFSNKKIFNLLNKKSGLKAISEISSDMRDILKKYKKDKNATLAINMYTKQIAEEISKHYVSLQEVDAIVFSGGIGENSALIRSLILDKLKFLDLNYNKKANTENKTKIHKRNSKTKIFIIKSNEQQVILEEGLKLLKIQ